MLGDVPEVQADGDGTSLWAGDSMSTKTYQHEELCKRAARWLSGTMRCEPVFTRAASCSEIPDAIGWTSRYQFSGSIVVECKASRADFYADKKKSIFWEHSKHLWRLPSKRMSKEVAEESGYAAVTLPLMGVRRYFMCAPGVITAELVTERHPDHGLLWLGGRRVRVIIQAPKREAFDYHSEIRYLRFAIINRKEPVERCTSGQTATAPAGDARRVA